MKNKIYFGKCAEGYVALMAVLIISLVTLMAASATSFGGFGGLSAVLNRENKEISLNLAWSCLDQAILRIVQSPSWQLKDEGENVFIDSWSCEIVSIEKEEDQFLIKTFSEVGRAATQLETRVEIKTDGGLQVKIFSVREI